MEGALRKKKAVVLARAEAERQAPDRAPGGRSLLQRWVASVLQPGGGAQAAGARIQALQDEVCGLGLILGLWRHTLTLITAHPGAAGRGVRLYACNRTKQQALSLSTHAPVVHWACKGCGGDGAAKRKQASCVHRKELHSSVKAIVYALEGGSLRRRAIPLIDVQVAALEALARAMFVEVMELRRERRRALESRTLAGHAKNLLGYCFSAYCLYRCALLGPVLCL